MIIIRGNSGSGKTTVARQLWQRFAPGAAMLVSQDEVRLRKDRAGNPAVALIDELVRFGLAHCDVVILEGILRADVYEPMLTNLLAAAVRMHAYYYTLTLAETLARQERRQATVDFGSDEVRRWWRGDDRIANLNEWPLTAKQNVAAAVALMLHDTGVKGAGE